LGNLRKKESSFSEEKEAKRLLFVVELLHFQTETIRLRKKCTILKVAPEIKSLFASSS
jgi:hypothetical protein